MKLDEITVKKDEYYTPPYAVRPILPYAVGTVWCPFDTEDSHFVKMLRMAGHKVIATHVWEGRDFFEYEPDGYDCVISNPPYSMKAEVFERLYELGRPFAMLIGLVGLFESQRRFGLFKYHDDVEIMFLNRRVSFFEDYADQKPSLNPPFSSGYVCRNLLPQRIMFAEIEKNHFVEPNKMV